MIKQIHSLSLQAAAKVRRLTRQIYQRRGAILRWVFILGWGGLTGFCLVFLPHIRRISERLVTHLDINAHAFDVAFWIGLYGLVAWLTFGIVGSKIEHLKYWRNRPPLILVGFFAIALSLIFKPLRAAGTWPTPTGVLAALLHASIFCTLVVWLPLLLQRLKTISEIERITSSEGAIPGATITSFDSSPNELTTWMRKEEPITCKHQDQFGLSDRAQRVLNALCTEERQTIGITGRYGSGKSSLIALVEEASLESQSGITLWFAKVSCWGFRDATAAQEAVLKQVVATVRKNVDVWGVRSLPEDYVRAISTANTAANIALSFLRVPLEPVEHLKRLSPILDAVHARLVIVVEDVDRSGNSFDFSHIQALLYRFREVEGMSFIITADPTHAPIDFAKLCDHQEDLEPLSAELVLEVIEAVRHHLLTLYKDDVELTARSAKLRLDPQHQAGWRSYAITYRHPSECLASLLGTPRALKSAMRRLNIAWSRLHGEVDFDELLYATALRVAAPTAFDYLRTHFDTIKQAPSPPQNNPTAKASHDTAVERLKEQWRTACQTREFDDASAERLIRDLLPGADAIFGSLVYGRSSGLQTCQLGKPSNYWQRIVSEGFQRSEPKDQPMMRAIRKSELGEMALESLAEQITGSDDASERFEHFGKEFNQLRKLISAVYQSIRRQHGRQARSEVPGFGETYRLANGRYASFEDPTWITWAMDEIKKSLPHHIHLVQDIYYRWIDRDGVDLKILRAARALILRTLRSSFNQQVDLTLCDCLDENDPYCLFQLLTPYDSTRKRYAPHSSDKVWAWIVPHFVVAWRKCPSRILPQLLIAFIHTSEHRSGKTIITYEFDQNRINLVLGKHKSEFMTVVAKGFEINPAFDGSMQQQMELAIARARQLI